MRRSRSTYDADYDHKRTKTTARSPSDNNHVNLMRYPFILPLVAVYLTDRNIFTRLLLTCRMVNQNLPNYRVKRWITPWVAQMLLDSSRYFTAEATQIHYVTDQDLSIYQQLRAVAYHLGYRDEINLPESVTHVELSKGWNMPLKRNMWPPQLQCIMFRNDFNQPIEPGMLPESLTSLMFGRNFDQPIIAGALPCHLIDVCFGGWHVQPFVSGTIPESVEHLIIGPWNTHNIPVGYLPRQLKHVAMPFDMIISEGLLPESLTLLHVEKSTELPKVLPATLTHIVSSHCYPITEYEHVFPSSVTHLSINCSPDPQEQIEPLVEGEIPSSITHLKLAFLAAPRSIPNSVTHLELTNDHIEKLEKGVIPTSVTHLTFGGNFNPTLLPGVIPDSVKVLNLGNHNKPLCAGAIPFSVQDLTFGKKFNQSLHPGVIPCSVKKLVFLSPFRHPLLKFEWLSDQQDLVTIRSIPNSVTELQCCWETHLKVAVGDIPNSVTKLTLGQPSDIAILPDFLYPSATAFSEGSIPSSVTDLDMGYQYGGWIRPGIIPDSVKRLKFGPCIHPAVPEQWDKRVEMCLADEDPFDRVAKLLKRPLSIYNRCFCPNFRSWITDSEPLKCDTCLSCSTVQ